MTVQDLIYSLQLIEDKTLPVTIEEDGFIGEITRVIYSSSNMNSLNKNVIILR